VERFNSILIRLHLSQHSKNVIVLRVKRFADRTSPKQSPGSSPGASLLEHYLIENSFYLLVLWRLLSSIQRCQDAIAFLWSECLISPALVIMVLVGFPWSSQPMTMSHRTLNWEY
jgi:hypothetical protein